MSIYIMKLSRYQKGHTKAKKRPSQKWSLNYMLCDHNLTFYCVFGLNWCRFTPETCKKSKKAAKGRKRPCQNDHYNSKHGTNTSWVMHPSLSKWYRRLENFEIAKKVIQRSCKGQKSKCKWSLQLPKDSNIFYVELCCKKILKGKIKFFSPECGTKAMQRPCKGHASQWAVYLDL